MAIAELCSSRVLSAGFKAACCSANSVALTLVWSALGSKKPPKKLPVVHLTTGSCRALHRFPAAVYAWSVIMANMLQHVGPYACRLANQSKAIAVGCSMWVHVHAVCQCNQSKATAMGKRTAKNRFITTYVP